MTPNIKKKLKRTKTSTKKPSIKDTAQKKVEESLQKDVLRYRTLMDRSRDGIAIINQEHEVVEANKCFAEMLGYTQNEIIGLHTWDWEAVMSEAEIRKNFADLTQTNVVFETRHRRKDGTIFDVEVSAGGTKMGNEPMVFTINRDITKRKLLEESIGESQMKYRSLYQEFRGILNAIPDALVLLSSDLKVIWSNEIAAKNMNMSLKDFVGQNCYKVRHGRSKPCEKCPVLECYVSLKPNVVEAKTPDGRIWELHAYPVFGDKGEVKGVIEAAHNITERRHAEEELKQHRKELLKRVKELEEFYNLAVGRELRMVELKKEIEQLKQQIEKHGISHSSKRPF